VIEDYFEPACRSLQSPSGPTDEVAGKIHFEYASFCADQLDDQHTISDIKRMESLYRTKSSEVQQYVETMQRTKVGGDQLAFKKLLRDHDRAVKLQKTDKEELQRLHALQRTFLRKAVEHFLRCFVASDEFDHHVPKFCAIWLKYEKQKGLHDIVRSLLPRVPSRKFLLLLHQLCSRLSDTQPDDFQHGLAALIERILIEHPYHSSHQIFSNIFGSGEASAAPRASSAREIAARATKNSKMRQQAQQNLLASLFDLYSAYSDLANLPLDKTSHAGNHISFSGYPGLRTFQGKRIADLHLPPPSLKIQTSIDLDYTGVPFILRFDQSFRVAGGINQPKILDSSLSNGVKFRELVI
jgi:serine-protein kinase ATM